MSTRSNIIIITPDNKIHQFYHHFDGYLSGVGEVLRSKLVYSLGLTTIIKDTPLYDFFISEIENCNRYDYYEDEYKHEMNDTNCLHSDIEYLYVIKDGNLYYINEYGLCDKLKTNKDIIDYVCKDNNKVDLSKRIIINRNL